MTIKDSGSRREFNSGAVRDIQDGKGRCDLLPLDAVGYVLQDRVLGRLGQFQDEPSIEHLKAALNEFMLKFSTNVSEYELMLEVSKHFEEGAKKYGEYNWQKGIPVHCYLDSAVRHYLKYMGRWQDEPHDRAFIWNILCCIWTIDNKPELNDMPNA